MMDMKQKPASPVTLLGNEADDGQYPYGLRIHLDSETLKRLGISEGNLPQVGAKFAISGLAEVLEVGKDDGQTEKGYRVELQIQQIELAAPEALNEQQAAHARLSKLYN